MRKKNGRELLSLAVTAIIAVSALSMITVSADPPDDGDEGYNPAYTKHESFSPTDELLYNPHIGFITQDGFNGGKRSYECLIEETEFEDWNGNLSNASTSYPTSTVSYCRLYWGDYEPQKGVYNFGQVDRLLRLAEQRHQTLMFRFMPYGKNPAWFGDEYPDAVNPANFAARSLRSPAISSYCRSDLSNSLPDSLPSTRRTVNG